MTDTREVFTILEDDSTAVGVKLPARLGDGTIAVAGNHVPVVGWQNSAGNYIVPSLTAAGAVPVDTGSAGTKKHDSTEITVAALNTEEAVIDLTALTISKIHTLQVALGSAFQPCLWRVVQIDDATTTELARFVTGSGDFNFGLDQLGCIDFTTGGSGTQACRLLVTQLRGGLTDAHGTLCIIEAP